MTASRTISVDLIYDILASFDRSDEVHRRSSPSRRVDWRLRLALQSILDGPSLRDDSVDSSFHDSEAILSCPPGLLEDWVHDPSPREEGTNVPI